MCAAVVRRRFGVRAGEGGQRNNSGAAPLHTSPPETSNLNSHAYTTWCDVQVLGGHLETTYML